MFTINPGQGGCLKSRLFFRVAAGLVSAQIEVGGKPPPYAVLESEHINICEDGAFTTEFWDSLQAVGHRRIQLTKTIWQSILEYNLLQWELLIFGKEIPW